MYCTKCGYELRDGDLFCGKCGTRVSTEPAQEHVGAAVNDGDNVQHEEKKACDEQKKIVTSSSRPRRRLPGKGLRKDLKLPPREIFSTRPLTLSVNGSCRYCGAKLSAQAECCPSCGAMSPEKLAKEKEERAKENRLVSMAEVKRAAEIGHELGGPLAADAAGSCGCLSILALINPFFWAESYCNSKAKKALLEGNLDLANELKDTSRWCGVGGFILIFIILGILFVVFK